MKRVFDDKYYDDFGFFIIRDKWSNDYKVIRDEDGWIFDKTYKNEVKAQEWIDSMIQMINNSKAIWNGSLHK